MLKSAVFQVQHVGKNEITSFTCYNAWKAVAMAINNPNYDEHKTFENACVCLILYLRAQIKNSNGRIVLVSRDGPELDPFYIYLQHLMIAMHVHT